MHYSMNPVLEPSLSQAEVGETMKVAAQDRKAIIRQSIAALSNRDYDCFRARHAEDVVLHMLGRDVHGIGAVIETEQNFFESFPDMQLVLEEVIVEGDMAAARHRGVGTHRGDFQSIAPTGARVELPVMMMCRFEDDKVVEVWLHSDRLGLLQQLGVIEPRGA